MTKEIYTGEDKKKLKLLKDLNLKDVKELLIQKTIHTKNEIAENIWEPWYLKIGLIGDTHLGAKQHAKDELGEFYDRAKSKKVEAILHAGDLLDWENVYKGHIYELDKHWFDEQLKEVVDSYPNNWLITYYIEGNHDESFLKNCWADIGKSISILRKDLICLWFYDARIKLNWIELELHHWGGSQSYAKSYKQQKYLENTDPFNQPKLVGEWHFHDVWYIFYRKIHSFLVWSFLKENLLAKRFKLGNTIWGWIIELEIDKKGGTLINMEFLKL